MQFRTWLESTELDALQQELQKSHPLENFFVSENEYKIELHEIRILKDERGRGHGAAVIRKLQDYARKVNKPIVLSPQPESKKKAKLLSFYRSLGFKPNTGRRRDYRIGGAGSGVMWVWRPS